jgi:hypothetical protein
MTSYTLTEQQRVSYTLEDQQRVSYTLTLDRGVIEVDITVADQSIAPGDSASFTATTNAYSPSYQWTRNGVAISGATSSTLVFTASIDDHNAVYRCIVTSPTSGTRYSNEITLSVVVPSYPIATFASDVGTTPTTTRLTVGSGHDCIVIDTGATSIEEMEFDLYVKLNATTRKIRTGRFCRLILGATAGDTVSFATSDGRSVGCFSSIKPTSFSVPSGTSGTANADAAEPRLWTATSPHVTLAALNQSIRVAAPASAWRDIFVREYDGTTWGSVVWYRLHPTYTGDVVIACFNKQIAIATQDGSTVSVTAPSGATIGGTSTAYSCITAATGTSRVVTANSESDLRAKMALATAGDEIVLPDGTYTLTVAISQSTFTANGGPHGITIRSQSGIAANCTIKLAATANSWRFNPAGTPAGAHQVKGITFDCASANCAGVQYTSNYLLRFEDVRFVDSRVGTTNNFAYVGVGSNATNSIFNRIYCYGASQDGLNFTGDGTVAVGPTLVNCVSEYAGASDSAQCLTTHSGLKLNVLGGHYLDAQLNVIANGGSPNPTIFVEFVRISKGTRLCNYRHVGVFGMICESWGGTEGCGGLNTDGFISHMVVDDSTTTAAGNAFSLIMQPVAYSFVRTPSATRKGFSWSTVASGTQRIEFNAFPNMGSNDNVAFSSFAAGSTAAIQLRNNTFANCIVAIRGGEDEASLLVRNTACSGNSFSIVVSSNASRITSDYNRFDPTATLTGGSFGANTTTNVDAALDSKLIPTSAGNCDNTGDPSLYDWIGGRDFTGWPLVYSLGESSVGARSRLRLAGTLLPNVWSVT